MRYSPWLSVLLFRKHPQQIAVVEVEGAEPRHLFGLFQISVEPAPKRLRPVFPLGAALDFVSSPAVLVVLAGVTGYLLSLLPRRGGDGA